MQRIVEGLKRALLCMAVAVAALSVAEAAYSTPVAFNFTARVTGRTGDPVPGPEIGDVISGSISFDYADALLHSGGMGATFAIYDLVGEIRVSIGSTSILSSEVWAIIEDNVCDGESCVLYDRITFLTDLDFAPARFSLWVRSDSLTLIGSTDVPSVPELLRLGQSMGFTAAPSQVPPWADYYGHIETFDLAVAEPTPPLLLALMANALGLSRFRSSTRRGPEAC